MDFHSDAFCTELKLDKFIWFGDLFTMVESVKNLDTLTNERRKKYENVLQCYFDGYVVSLGKNILLFIVSIAAYILFYSFLLKHELAVIFCFHNIEESITIQ